MKVSHWYKKDAGEGDFVKRSLVEERKVEQDLPQGSESIYWGREYSCPVTGGACKA
jgi:hypothetical protein